MGKDGKCLCIVKNQENDMGCAENCDIRYVSDEFE